MGWIITATIILLFICAWKKRKQVPPDLSVLPETFVVFDLETTGLDAGKNEIIEIGAIRVHRGSDTHDTFQALVMPKKKVPKRITEITGITQAMVENEGEPIDSALPQFVDFVGTLPLVSFNADFDMAFLRAAIDKVQPGALSSNPVSCALKMARRAWPGRKSYRLPDLAKDGGLSSKDTHRALGDCERAMRNVCLHGRGRNAEKCKLAVSANKSINPDARFAGAGYVQRYAKKEWSWNL